MSKYKGLFTFDIDSHKYVSVAQADGIIDTMDYEPDSKPAEPLIKDEKIRKAIRAWAELNRFDKVKHLHSEGMSGFYCEDIDENEFLLDFTFPIAGLAANKAYTIAELCGEEEE